MFKTILLAVDGSEHSEKAAELAAQLAIAGNDEIVVTHVTELLPSRYQVQPGLDYEFDKDAFELARGYAAVMGGGGTGAALAHDLALRGLRVTLLERGELTSGTTGRHHGLLHSGARYAVADAESAVECIQENRILRRIAPGSFEENGGLFVALTDEDMDYKPGFLAACAACDIPTRELTPAEALQIEPSLNPALKAAVWVPDATMDAMRLPLRFFASARRNGADLHPFTEVTGLLRHGALVTGVAVHDHLTGRDAEIQADLVVNSTGPWCERLAGMAGADVPVRPSPGVLLALRGRLCYRVVNRLHAAGEAASGRHLSRTFKCFDHAVTDGVEGFVTITGGKATTLRAMAEAAAVVVCAKLGVQVPCRTRET